jgi:carotenoid cleavage dioxygenase
VVKEWRIKAPYVGIMHDCAITQKHILIPLVARTTSMERLKKGEPMWDWDGSKETMVAVIPRDGESKDVRWFRGPARNTLHFLNATDRKDKITMEMPVSDGETTPSHIKRWTFNLNSKKDQFDEEVVSMANSPLARMDDRFLSLDYKYCFVGNSNADRPNKIQSTNGRPVRATNEYLKVDVRTGKTNAYFAGETHGLQECMFAPRARGGAEGDGYLLGIANNFADMSSELHIVDAQRMEEGAVAVVKLPFRLRGGTHTNWVPTWELPLRGKGII